MMGWEYFPKSTPRKVANGIQIKSKRGAIGEQWWAKRFIDALQRMGLDSRLARGRSYARKGQVARFSIKNGVVTATVQGSQPRPYSVEIKLKKWDEKQWRGVISEVASQALYSAELLGGEMPHEIESIVEKAKVHLFPSSGRDIETDCDCPDFANPCKHIAAVYYILAERFDEDPFLIFSMRGKEKDQLLEEIRNERGTPEPEQACKMPHEDIPNEPAISNDAAGFYQFKIPLDNFTVRPSAGPEVKGALLRRLGPSPLFIGKTNFSDLLAQVYDFCPEYVRRIVHGEEGENPDRD